jgi:serine/threonine protein kinase
MWPFVRHVHPDQVAHRPELGQKSQPSISKQPKPAYLTGESMESDWAHRYERATKRPVPGSKSIDGDWMVKKTITNADGAFNGGIDLVQNIKTGEVGIRKRLLPRPGCAAHDSARWKREMLILRKLDHPNIPYYIDGWHTTERGSLYMQACLLGSLSDFIDGGLAGRLLPHVHEYFLWYVMRQVGSAILYMQTGYYGLRAANRSKAPSKVPGWVSVVHADIRPDQIFLHATSDTWSPCALLGDFGFGQFLKPWEPTPRHDGPGGRSSSKGPEFPAQISLTTDIFGLGATAQIYLVPERKPVAGLARGELSRKTGVSDDLDFLVCACVASAPADRPGIRSVMATLDAGLDAQQKKLQLDGHAMSSLLAEWAPKWTRFAPR